MIFKINDDIARLIRLQRTWAKKLDTDQIGLEYWKSCQRDYEQVKRVITPGDSILDIGCGLAGADLIIKRNVPNVDIVLFDLDRVDAAVKYGYSREPSAYNTRQAVEEFYQLNGADAPIYVSEYPAAMQFDVIMSLISYGFHYPVETYLDQVMATLRPGGRLVLDIRKDSGQVKLLRQFFPNVALIDETKSYSRMAFTR